MTGASDSFATLTFAYDSGGRVSSTATSGAAGTQPLVTLTYGYDAFGNKTSMSDSLSGSGWAGQGVTSYAYDAAFRLTTMTQTFGGNAGPQVLLGYDSGGRLTSIDRTIAGAGTSVNTSLVYDAANRLGTIVDQAGTTGLATFLYGYDSGNRLTSENDVEIAGGVTYTYNATYAYDHADELTGATATLDGSAANESYAYDSGGNRNTTGYTVGGDNALTASPGYTYTYDNEGNMTAKTQTSTGDIWTYTYDDRNRLTAVLEKSSGGTTLNQATYVYDALDRRIGIDDNSTQTWIVFDAQNPYADFTGAGSLATRYLSGAAIDELFARTSASGTSAWYLTDNLGSVRDIVSSAGSILDHLAYDSFGNIKLETNASNGDRFKYAGLQWDPTAQTYLSEHRPFDAGTGRWISQDPLGFGGGDFDLYRYVANVTTDKIDPLGLQVPMGVYHNPRPKPTPVPPLTSPYFTTTTFSGESYISTEFPTPVFPTTPYSNLNIGYMGCVGLASLRSGVCPPMDLNKDSTALAWFNNPEATLEYYNGLTKGGRNPNLMIIAIQSSNIPNIGYVTPYPGMIYPIGGKWKVGELLYNYATWQQPRGGIPFWEYANNGNGIKPMNAIRSGTLPGAPYVVTIYGVVPSKSPYMTTRK